MKLYKAQRWFGLFFLISTVMIGCYLLLSPPNLLPLEDFERMDCFKIIIPVFVGQLIIIFQWLSNLNNSDNESVLCPIPGWAIFLPPILSLGIIAFAAISLIMSNSPESNSSVSPDTFKNALTFSVTLLNATTIYLIAKIFPKKDDSKN